jgi:hypothetical protein
MCWGVTSAATTSVSAVVKRQEKEEERKRNKRPGRMKKENVEIGECFGGTSCSGAADYEKHHSRSNGTALLYCVRTVKVTITKGRRKRGERAPHSSSPSTGCCCWCRCLQLFFLASSRQLLFFFSRRCIYFFILYSTDQT